MKYKFGWFIWGILPAVLFVALAVSNCYGMTYPYQGISRIQDNSASICPKTRMADNQKCLLCHTRDWRLIEIPWDAHLVYPTAQLRFLRNSSESISEALYVMISVSSQTLEDILRFCNEHNVKKLRIDIQCFGGSAFEMWRFVGLLNEWKNIGGIVRTEVRGFAGSAAFLIFAAGTKGERFVSPTAELMWHEVQVMDTQGITTPSDTEEKGRIFRHFQDTAHKYLSSVSKLTKDELDEKVRHREFWMSGKQAFEYGFADGLIDLK